MPSNFLLILLLPPSSAAQEWSDESLMLHSLDNLFIALERAGDGGPREKTWVAPAVFGVGSCELSLCGSGLDEARVVTALLNLPGDIPPAGIEKSRALHSAARIGRVRLSFWSKNAERRR